MVPGHQRERPAPRAPVQLRRRAGRQDLVRPATTKDVWEELQQNQKFEASSWWPGHGWLILRGKAGLEGKTNADMRYAGYAHLCSLGESYDGPDDPTLVFFSVEEPEAWICNHEEWKPIEL
ncbi:hypothetical protein [Senegalimassilia anaerobia]